MPDLAGNNSILGDCPLGVNVTDSERLGDRLENSPKVCWSERGPGYYSTLEDREQPHEGDVSDHVPLRPTLGGG
jgi:hypothetical protein